MDSIISVSRQRKQTIIFITHTMRKFAVTLLLDIDILLCKKPSLLHSKLERSEVRKLVEEVSTEFRKLPKDEVKKNTYVITESYTGFIRNNLCSYWSEELSEAFAGISINGKKEEKEMEEEEVVLPSRIESGLKLWFNRKNMKKVLRILSKNSKIDGVLSEMGVQCANGKCFYTFDLKRVGDKYTLPNDKFDLEKSFKEFEEKEISVVVDTESSGFPVEVVFKPVSEKKQEKKDKIEEYAKSLKI